jgi:hypothetical protein
VFVGDGPTRPDLERLVDELGQREAVTFAGSIYDETQLAPWMLSATLMCYPFSAGLSLLHSFGYGLVAYQTAYLKANFPCEYFAALLTSVKANKDQTAVFLNECRQLGIEVLVPDVNESESDFSVHPAPGGEGEKGKVRFGMSAVRNVGEGVVAQIVASREERPFVDFYDFCDRVDPTDVADLAGRDAPEAHTRVRLDRRNGSRPRPHAEAMKGQYCVSLRGTAHCNSPKDCARQKHHGRAIMNFIDPTRSLADKQESAATWLPLRRFGEGGVDHTAECS